MSELDGVLASLRAWRDDAGFKVPPDAGNTIMGAYGLKNGIVTWLLSRYPELLELTPLQLQRLRVPKCPYVQLAWVCREPMRLVKAPAEGRRPERLAWRCARHQPATQIDFELPKQERPRVGLRQLINATKAGMSVEWQRPYAFGGFQVEFVAPPRRRPKRSKL